MVAQNPDNNRPPGRRLNKKLLDRIDVVTAVANVNNPGLTPEMVRQLVKAALAQGLEAKDALRFIQGRMLGTFGDDLQGAIDLFSTTPGSLASAIRLGRELGRMKFDRPEDEDVPFVGRRGTFKTLFAGLHPEFKDLFVKDAPTDEEGNYLDEEGGIDEELNSFFGPIPTTSGIGGFDVPEPVTGDEDFGTMSGVVQSMLQARQNREAAQMAYGETFTYDELIGGEE